MTVYYNEFDPYCAEWLHNLINKGHLPAGVVDTRSIVDVQPADLEGFTQCHFFAGIGGWALAAQIADWPEDRELWTGSCPCQPFSNAGKQGGTDDPRHLWPHQLRLIRARRPAVWMGEQVAAATGKGWIDGVLTDLEGIGYAGRATVIPACAVNGPHRRDRLWVIGERTVDHGIGEGLEGRSRHGTRAPGWSQPDRPTPAANSSGVVAHADSRGTEGGVELRQPGDAINGSAWQGATWLTCHDGKNRRVEPSIRLLAHGVPARVGRLRAYGNAIVPQVAAEVIAAYMEYTNGE